MPSLFKPTSPSSFVHQSPGIPTPVLWASTVLATLLIGWSAYKAYTSGMPWLALIQLVLTLASVIAATTAAFRKEQEKAWRRVITIFCLSFCVDLLRLR